MEKFFPTKALLQRKAAERTSFVIVATAEALLIYNDQIKYFHSSFEENPNEQLRLKRYHRFDGKCP